MFRTKSMEKFFNKICNNSLSRKSIFYKKKLHIDGNETNICIHKIKSKNDFIKNISEKMNWDNNLVYWMSWTNKLPLNLIQKNVDIIFCDSKLKVISFYKNVNKNSNIEITNEIFNVWICKIGFIDFHNINLNTCISTKPM